MKTPSFTTGWSVRGSRRYRPARDDSTDGQAGAAGDHDDHLLGGAGNGPSPWLVLLLLVGVLPSFVGETHFAFLGYAKNFRQTPAKRQMDYLRQVAGSRDGAKEVKLFGLHRFFTDRFKALADHIYREDVKLARSKLFLGGLLGIIGTLGYYGAYVYVIWRTLGGQYDIGPFFFLTTSIQQASSNLQQVFSTASGIADQALFLT